MFVAACWLPQSEEFWVPSGLSGALPRRASGWSGAGARMMGEWAWEWAACVPSG